MSKFKESIIWVASIYIAIIFVQSLFFKFTNSPETIYIFEAKLNPWSASLGFPGLFAPGGIFSAKVVGTFELVASILVVIGAFAKNHRMIQVLGAAMSMGVISGAIFFHLFTPLGIAVVNTDGTSDNGELFSLACGVWAASFFILILRRDVWMPVLCKILKK